MLLGLLYPSKYGERTYCRSKKLIFFFFDFWFYLRQLHDPLNYLTSSSTVIPLLLLLILIIYYLVSLTGALREANQDLRTQLQKEREEERKKIFKVTENKPSEQTTINLTNRWRKVLEASSPLTPTQPIDFESEEYKSQARKGNKVCDHHTACARDFLFIYFSFSQRINYAYNEKSFTQRFRDFG